MNALSEVGLLSPSVVLETIAVSTSGLKQSRYLHSAACEEGLVDTSPSQSAKFHITG